MGDDQSRHRRGHEEALEPGERIEIEMIGGLVKEQQVRFINQKRGEPKPGPLTATQRGKRLVVAKSDQPQPSEHLTLTRLALSAAQFFDACDSLFIIGQGKWEVGRANTPGGRRLDRPQRLRARRCSEHLADRRLIVAVLSKLANLRARRNRDGAGISPIDARDEVKDRRLAAAIGANEPNMLHGIDPNTAVSEDGSRPRCFAKEANL